MEEVKRLKALKMREIRKKLGMVSKESGFAEDGEFRLFFMQSFELKRVGRTDDTFCDLRFRVRSFGS